MNKAILITGYNRLNIAATITSGRNMKRFSVSTKRDFKLMEKCLIGLDPSIEYLVFNNWSPKLDLMLLANAITDGICISPRGEPIATINPRIIVIGDHTKGQVEHLTGASILNRFAFAHLEIIDDLPF